MFLVDVLLARHVCFRRCRLCPRVFRVFPSSSFCCCDRHRFPFCSNPPPHYSFRPRASPFHLPAATAAPGAARRRSEISVVAACCSAAWFFSSCSGNDERATDKEQRGGNGGSDQPARANSRVFAGVNQPTAALVGAARTNARNGGDGIVLLHPKRERESRSIFSGRKETTTTTKLAGWLVFSAAMVHSTQPSPPKVPQPPPPPPLG